MRQRRRAERGQPSQLRPRNLPSVSRREAEAKQRQLLFIGAGFVLLIIVGLLAYGWFTSTFQPPRKTVGSVLGVPVKLADVVPYTALDSLDLGGSLRPTASLNNVIRDRIVRHYAGELNVEVTDAEVEQALVNRFEPVPPDSSETRDQLSEDGREAFAQLQQLLGVTEGEYRGWLRGRLYLTELRDHFDEVLPEEAPQVHVEWIITATQSDAQAALDRVNGGEDFLEVAKEVNEETGLSEDGVVGWVPEGAILELDGVLFSEDLVLGELNGPLTTSAGYVVLRVTEGPETREISETMRGFVVGNQMQGWLDGKLLEADVTGPNMDSGDVDWVINQII